MAKVTLVQIEEDGCVNVLASFTNVWRALWYAEREYGEGAYSALWREREYTFLIDGGRVCMDPENIRELKEMCPPNIS